MKEALEAAQNVYGKEDATPEEIKAAYDALKAAMEALEEPVDPEEPADKTDLEEAIEEAKNADKEGKTEESVKALEDAIAAAQTVLEDDEADEQAIADAIAALDAAVAGLTDTEEPVDPEEPADKEALEKAIKEAEKADKEGKTDESVKALEDAIAAAQKVLEDDEADEQAIADAIAALDAAVAGLTDAEEPAEDKIAVASVEADNTKNPKEVKVTLDGEFTEEELAELADTTITLTDADGKAITATFKKMSEDGKAIFEAAEDLEDAKVYTVTSEDLSVPANTTVTAEVVEAYAKEFFTNTEKISDKNKVVVFQAKDQYGEVMEQFPEKAEVTVTWKGMPLVEGTDFTVEPAGKVTVKKDIPVGNELTFNVTLKEADKEEVTFSKTFEVEEGKAAALTSVAEVTADKEEVKPEDEVTLTASFLDQYKNENTLGTDDEIRWVIKEGADLITVKGSNGEAIEGNVINKTGSDAGTLLYTANKPGKVAIEVFVTATGESAPYEVTIGEADLKEITVEKIELEKDEKIYNNKDKAIATIKPNEGAKMTPEDVKFEVVDENGEDASEVVTVKAQEPEVKEGEEVEKDAPLNIVVNSTKSGTYKVTPYIEVDGKKVYSKDDEGNVKTIEFTTEVENNITAISELDFSDETELKVGKEIRKDITFTNEHGEPVLVETEASKAANEDRPTVEITAPSTLTVNIVDKKDEEGNIIGQEVVMTANKAGKAVLFIDAGENAEPASYNLEFVNAVLTKVEFGEKKVTGLVAGEKTAKYNKVTFKDQHDVEMTTDTKNLNIVVTDKDGKVIDSEGVQFVKGNFNDEGTFAEEAENAEDFIKIVSSDDELNGTYTITVTDKKTDEGAVAEDAKVKESFEVEVGAAREVKEIKAEPKSSTVALGSPVTVDVTVTDQYGEAFNLPDGEAITAQLIDPETEEATEDKVNVTAVEGKDGKHTATVTPENLGTYDLVFTYTKGDGEDKVEVTETVAVHVGIAAEVVKSIEFADFEDEETERVMIKDGKPVYKSTKDQTYTLTPKAKDADGNPVNFKAEELTWTSSNTDLVTVNGGEVEVVSTPTEDTEVTVTAKMLDVSQSITFVVSADSTPKALPESITMTVPTEEATLEVTEVTIDENATDGAIEVTYTAVDQFGKDFAVDFTDTKIESFNPTVATAVKGSKNNTIKITAVGESETGTKIRTTIDGNDVDLKVIVKKEAVVIAQDAKTLADALPKVPGVKEDKPLTIEGKDTNPSAKAVKEAVEKEIQAKENGIAVEVVNATDNQDVARSTQENVDGQGTEEEIKTVEYNVTLSKGDAEKQELTVYAQFVLDPETEAANALTKAKEEAISQLKQQFPAENYTGTGEGDAGNKEAYDKAMKAAEEAINAATDQAAVATALTEQQTKLAKVKTDNQLDKEANEEAAKEALSKAEKAAGDVQLANGEEDVNQNAAVTAIEEAIKEALKDDENEFAGTVKVTVEEDGFKAATNGTSETEAGTAGSIKFKITITVGENDVEGTATSEKVIELNTAPKAFDSETDEPGEGSGGGTSEGSQTEPGTPGE